MKKRRSTIARLLAVLALVGAIVALAILIPVALENSGDSKKSSDHPAKQEPKKQRTKAKAYVVKTGDTLIGIAHKTGVPISEIRALNPEIDPQILIAGETLKLR